MEYPGYGIYKGSPTEIGILRDIAPVVNFLTKVCDISLDSIISMGRSIGTGPATHLACSYAVMGLILVSPFRSVKTLVQVKYGFMSAFVNDRFENEKKFCDLHCPCLFIHGDDDDVIPPSESKALYGRI